jgi:integrase
MIRALMLTGARLDEVAGARWREFDWPRRLWSVPAERYKSKAEHIVPLSNDAVALFDNLPRWSNGDYLFSTRVGRKPDDTKASKRARKKPDGKKPVNGFSKAKARIDAHIGEVPHWVLHDIRRTVRTRLSALRIPDPIAEMVIGHAKKGLARVYDQHKYVDEMREALEAWSACLRRIVRPPDNVVEFPKAAVTSG